MSASGSSIISRSVRALLCFVGAWQPAAATTKDLNSTFDSLELSNVTTSLVNWPSVGNLIAVLEAQWPSTVILANALRAAAVPDAMPSGSESAGSVEASGIHPIAKQLAVTLRMNVAKGRRPARKAASPKAKPHRRTATAIKAKPVVTLRSKKRAPKRRHVWLSNQTRIVRPVVNNVTSFQRPSRSNARSAMLRNAPRLTRIAA
jgi:hypothetical protein